MKKLRLKKIICYKTDDASEDDSVFDVGVEDEVRLMVDYKQVWSGRMSPKSEKELSHIEQIAFEDSIHIKLVEHDPGYSNQEDDVLGEIILYENTIAMGSNYHLPKSHPSIHSHSILNN
jgi:hypothetical protein